MKLRKARVLIFGCGNAGRQAYPSIRRKHHVVGFLDNDLKLHGTSLLGLPVHPPTALSGLGYDRIIIASMYHREILAQLVENLRVPRWRIEIAGGSSQRSRWTNFVLGLMQMKIPFVRTVLVLEEYQWAWTKLRIEAVFREGLRRGMWFGWHQVSTLGIESAVPHAAEATLEETYRGVRLFPAVAYSLCVDLEVAMSEFSWRNPEHQARAAQWYAVARAVVDELYKVFGHQRPRAVVGMQGYFVSTAVARQLAPTFGFQFFALENTFYPRRFICEPLSGIAVNRTAAPLFYRQREDLLPPGSYVPWLDGLLAGLDGTKVRDHASPSCRFQWPVSRKRIVFLGQVYTDSSVLFGTRDNATAVSILRVLLEYIDKRDAFLLAKLHPKEKAGVNTLWAPYNRLTWRKLNDDPQMRERLAQRGCEQGWEIDEDNRFSTAALLQDCDVVVTINSQGGLEALGYGKNVLLLGDAFYGNLGLTLEVPRLALLPPLLDAVLFGGVSLVDREAVARFLYVYLNNYCLERTEAAFVAGIHARSYGCGAFAAAYSLPSAPPANGGV